MIFPGSVIYGDTPFFGEHNFVRIRRDQPSASPSLHGCFPLVDGAVREPTDFFQHVTGTCFINTCTFLLYGFDDYRQMFSSSFTEHIFYMRIASSMLRLSEHIQECFAEVGDPDSARTVKLRARTVSCFGMLEDRFTVNDSKCSLLAIVVSYPSIRGHIKCPRLFSIEMIN